MDRSGFENKDDILRAKADEVRAERAKLGLDGAVGGLECVIVNVEPGNVAASLGEFLGHTGYGLSQCFQAGGIGTCVLSLEGSADILVRTRTGDNPFRTLNDRPKSRHLPGTRLESLVFGARDLERLVAVQRARGVTFMTPEPVRGENYLFIQTAPSRHTGNSIGFIEWTGRREYHTADAEGLAIDASKPGKPHLRNIGFLDHAATRVRAEERDDAIIEFMGLTNYDFQMAIRVESLNSITNVARLGPEDFAMVFTSGIGGSDAPDPGPTEMFIRNYGPRVHHLAFATESIEATVAALAEDGQQFLSELVGSREDGLKQIFTRPYPQTLLVHEYIQRYDGFDGFFTKANVTGLTLATKNQ